MRSSLPRMAILAGVKAQAGDVVAVGKIIAWIVRPGEAPPSEVAAARCFRSTARLNTTRVRRPSYFRAGRTTGRADFSEGSPACQGARSRHQRLARIRTGRGNPRLRRFSRSRVERFLCVRARIETLKPPVRLARLMAERTTQSWTTVPHFFVVREVDAGALVEARETAGISD